MTVQVIEFVQSLANHPVTELSECDVLISVVLFQQLLEGRMGIVDLDVPVIDQHILAIQEFSLVQSSLAIFVEGLEVLPELIVKPQVDQGPFECTS